MENITIMLNGVPVSAPPGTTILELAKEVGIDIPTLCHDEHLKPYGACRICIVEDESTGRLLASCVTPIAKGMNIKTHSPRVIESRKNIIKLMLASHPESCIVCDKGNRCQLRKVAAELGIGLSDLDPIPQPAEIVDANPFIVRDLSKCILCAKCIRADHELVVQGAIDYVNRGFDAYPATLGMTSLEKSVCTFCGTCLTVCPTGALAEKRKTLRGTAADWTPSVCPYCGCGCSILLGTKGGIITEISPNLKDPLDRLTLCARGHFGTDFVHSHERIREPLIRREGTLVQTSWDEALTEASKAIKAIAEQYGPDSVAIIGSPRLTNEENYMLQKLARAVIGTNNIDTAARIHAAPYLIAMEEILGFNAASRPLGDIERADLIFVVGAYPSSSHPVASYHIKRAVHLKGAELIVASSAPDYIDRFATMKIRPEPASEAMLLAGLLLEIMREDGEIEERFPELWNSVKSRKTTVMEKAMGIQRGSIRSLAEHIDRAKRPAIVFGTDIIRNPLALDCCRAISYLSFYTGASAEDGGGIYPIGAECNTHGAWDMGAAPERLPGTHIRDKKVKADIETAWGRKLPARKGLALTQLPEAIVRGDVRALIVFAEDMIGALPDKTKTEQALSALALLIAVDIFPGKTTDLAHIVLPGAAFAEKEGTFTTIDRRVQKINPACPPPGSARAEWQIIRDLALMLGDGDIMDYPSVENTMTEINSLVASYSGISYQALSKGGIPQPCNEAAPRGTAVLCHGIQPIDTTLNLPPAGEEKDTVRFPLKLIVVPSLYRFGTGSRWLRSEKLKGIEREMAAVINPAEAGARGLTNGSEAELVASAGSIKVRIETDKDVAPGRVVVPAVLPDGPVERILPFSIEQKTKTTLLIGHNVEIRRL